MCSPRVDDGLKAGAGDRAPAILPEFVLDRLELFGHDGSEARCFKNLVGLLPKAFDSAARRSWEVGEHAGVESQ